MSLKLKTKNKNNNSIVLLKTRSIVDNQDNADRPAIIPYATKEVGC